MEQAQAIIFTYNMTIKEMIGEANLVIDRTWERDALNYVLQGAGEIDVDLPHLQSYGQCRETRWDEGAAILGKIAGAGLRSATLPELLLFAAHNPTLSRFATMEPMNHRRYPGGFLWKVCGGKERVLTGDCSLRQDEFLAVVQK
ncbi:MAG: hypothetical protein KBC50_00640 [Candidatus Pacebacteria bacterium]|jgi:hypothetical protein|nr:hypothetical protein [Candidatus Paceibacterota bacterium]